MVQSLQEVGSAPNVEPEVWSLGISQTGKWRGKPGLVESQYKWEPTLLDWSPKISTGACGTDWSLRLSLTTSNPNAMGEGKGLWRSWWLSVSRCTCSCSMPGKADGTDLGELEIG